MIDRDDNEAAIDVFDEALDQLLGEWTDELTELACDATGELCQLDAASDAASDADDDNDAQTARRAARTARSPLQSLEHLNSGDAGEHIDNSASGVARGVLRQIVFSVAADGAGIDWLAVDIDLEAGWDIAAAAALQSNESVVAIDANSPATRDPRDRSAGLAAGK
ncbi:MAG: hypothetical protein QGG36_08205 [Pirellulaceae bacterium]|nr:hypothetical protein [Pirellulaceae bacterium]MDP7015766.1 hypothetical protein [Pirellulaceae bacterium]